MSVRNTAINDLRFLVVVTRELEVGVKGLVDSQVPTLDNNRTMDKPHL